jgi:predicted small lipoprotein YifL
MLRRFRPFRSSLSMLLVLAAMIFTMAACDEKPTGPCQYNEQTNTCN